MPNTLPNFSFRNKVREAIYIRRDNVKSKFHDYIFSLDMKSIAYPFVENLGIKCPKLFYKNEKLENIQINDIDGSFVLKPEQAHSSLGVYLCHNEHGNYHELLTNRTVSKQQIIEEAFSIMKEKKFSNKWMLEELVYPDDGKLYALDDWKFYCFYGEVGLILQKHKGIDGEITYKLYDESLVEAKNTGKYIGKIDSNLPLARNVRKMLDAARKLSSNVPLPFVRVDLFSSSEGVIFGEFTPFPGGFSMFWKAWDEKLGKMWMDAEARLDRDIKNGCFQEKYKSIGN
ncbi:ATP-grasp fold amidoligase family protein [Acinetobacter equi]|uniref:ATP-grasp domain-containing protein n=1 Tax=Acinetobacter equi TaxID=1324350 RepID=A0A0N9VC71_9GAMM|nr:ATP-grasp fold amidoligase family protein [Acinetobacter equi]ALH94688.1 hypothetical protein AOY20_03595 [Acinetobacter equi]